MPASVIGAKSSSKPITESLGGNADGVKFWYVAEIVEYNTSANLSDNVPSRAIINFIKKIGIHGKLDF